MNRKRAKEELFLLLEKLARCCQPPEKWRQTLWPGQVFLQSLENNVILLIKTERKNRPSPAWKAFQLLDKRMPKLLLVKRVDNLIKRAGDRLEEAARRPLSKLRQQAECGDGNAKKLLRDIAAIRKGQDVAKEINWIDHERALAQFSRTRSVEPSYGRSAPPEFRCYARALELIVDDCRREPLNSWPLTEWTAQIGHPDAKSLLAFDDPTGFLIEEGAWRVESRRRKREQGLKRLRSHREWKKGRWVYPGDWIRFRSVPDFRAFWGRKQPLPETCVGLDGSDCRDGLAAVLNTLSCERNLADEPDGFYYHRTLHIGRCRDCQNAEWIEQGFEVVDGFPYGHWNLTTAERIAEREQHDREVTEREQRRLKTRGRAGLLA